MKISKIGLSLGLALSLSACGSMVSYLSGQDGWYRDLRTQGWKWSGAKPAAMTQVIADLEKNVTDTSKQVDKQVATYQAGNWNYEWDQVGNAAKKQGDYLAATMYHTIAAYPLVKGNALANQSYKMAINNYVAAVKKAGFNIEELKLDTADGQAHAFLHLPSDSINKPMRTLVMTNGSDHALTQLFPVYRDYLNKQGWAFITFDLPGLGSNESLTQNPKETNIIHKAVLNYIKQDNRLATDKVALLGKSFGGNAAIKTAFTNPDDIAGAISWCGAVNKVFMNFDFVLNKIPEMTKDSLMSRFGLPKDELASHGPDFALSTEYLGKVTTPVPMLAINHANDRISPVSDLKLIAQSSKQGEYIVVEEEINQGHCSSEDESLVKIMNWLNKTIQ